MKTSEADIATVVVERRKDWEDSFEGSWEDSWEDSREEALPCGSRMPKEQLLTLVATS